MTKDNPFKDVKLGIRCAKCGLEIIRPVMPYTKIGDDHYHNWCLEESAEEVSNA